MLMNSDPLSESIPRIGRRNGVEASSGARDHPASSFVLHRSVDDPAGRDVGHGQGETELAAGVTPSWLTKSISRKPGWSSVHSAQVRMGIWLFERVPDLV
jgi:hypothetical protein